MKVPLQSTDFVERENLFRLWVDEKYSGAKTPPQLSWLWSGRPQTCLKFFSSQVAVFSLATRSLKLIESWKLNNQGQVM